MAHSRLTHALDTGALLLPEGRIAVFGAPADTDLTALEADRVEVISRHYPDVVHWQDRGYRVALVTDGRMSGASGKVPAAIHCTPEALGGGPLSKLRDGDIVKVCAETGTLSTTADLDTREPAAEPEADIGMGRELFAMFRANADGAEQGASSMLAMAGL